MFKRGARSKLEVSGEQNAINKANPAQPANLPRCCMRASQSRPVGIFPAKIPAASRAQTSPASMVMSFATRISGRDQLLADT